MTYTIRRATAQETHTAAQLAVQMWEDATPEALEAEFAAQLQSGESTVLLALCDKQAVGFAQCGLRHDYVEGCDTSPVGYLEGVFVKEPHRRKGVARRLLAACEDWARGKGCREFASDCELENRDSLAFHMQNGFAEANRIICFCKKL